MRFILAAALLLGVSAQPAVDSAELWKAIQAGLTGPKWQDFWEHHLKYAVIPDRLVPGGLKATVVSSEPADHPHRLTLAVSDDATPEVTLRVSPPLKEAFPRGTLVRFQGVAEEFAREPFMLTFDVDQDGTTFIEKASKQR